MQQPTGGQGSSGTAQDHHVTPGATTAHNLDNPPNPPLSTNTNINHLQQTLPNKSSLIHSMLAGPIQPYQSGCTMQVLPAAPQGHPSPTVAIAAANSSMQPILGRDTLSLNVANQVNQEHRASAVAHVPRWQTVPTCGTRHRRGPATPTPSMARRPNIDDCLGIGIPDENGGHTLSIRVKVKVYPPQVSISDLLSRVTSGY